MPIYAYKCESCGHAKDVLQKMADAPLSDCPACGQPSFKKQLTAAGFQLKGNGWYATDFKGGSGGTTAPAVSTPTEGGATASETAITTSATASDSSPAAAGGCGSSCACH